ncbi:hypothetical protein BT63DRAFT_441516 [Microthyrium microscopicum]|uniref:BTB domain-containing protein n=1 Tax=Microthyrium microscopicum TaxID=703497 RepID=A0A6A6U6W1_9PEZI|nr:hypothetical protein BT63DRAFT_441516 [Microthyrium microscopicum]
MSQNLPIMPNPTKRSASDDDVEQSSKRRKVCTKSSQWDTRRPSAGAFSFSGPTIQVTVGQGDESCTFIVLIEPLILDSGFFRSMLRSNKFKEGADGVVSLPDHQPATFNLYLNYIYRGKLFVADGVPKEGIEDEEDTSLEEPEKPDELLENKIAYAEERMEELCEATYNKEVSKLIPAISLADYLQSDGFHNASMDALIESGKEFEHLYAGPKEIIQVMNTGVPSLIKPTEDFYVYSAYLDSEWFGAEQDAPAETSTFWRDVMKEYLTRVKFHPDDFPDKCPWEVDRCQYHRH